MFNSHMKLKQSHNWTKDVKDHDWGSSFDEHPQAAYFALRRTGTKEILVHDCGFRAITSRGLMRRDLDNRLKIRPSDLLGRTVMFAGSSFDKIATVAAVSAVLWRMNPHATYSTVGFRSTQSAK